MEPRKPQNTKPHRSLNVPTAGSCMRGFRTPDGTRNPSPFRPSSNLFCCPIADAAGDHSDIVLAPQEPTFPALLVRQLSGKARRRSKTVFGTSLLLVLSDQILVVFRAPARVRHSGAFCYVAVDLSS